MCDKKRILVVDDGVVVEVGTHEELMNKKGVFYNMVMMHKEFSKEVLKYQIG